MKKDKQDLHPLVMIILFIVLYILAHIATFFEATYLFFKKVFRQIRKAFTIEEMPPYMEKAESIGYQIEQNSMKKSSA